MGTGSALLRAHQQVLDRDRLPAYLQAADLHARRFYARHGYVALPAPRSSTPRTARRCGDVAGTPQAGHLLVGSKTDEGQPKDNYQKPEGCPVTGRYIVDSKQPGTPFGSLEITCRRGFSEVPSAVTSGRCDCGYADECRTTSDSTLVDRHGRTSQGLDLTQRL